jgi:C1A family cysteine protease
MERKLGWIRDYPDFRDLTINTDSVPSKLQNQGQPSVKTMMTNAGVLTASTAKLPASKTLRSWCSPIEDQGDLGSCTAHAAVGMLEYFERKSFGKYTNASRMFVYKTTRNLMKVTGDTGAYLRSVMGALTLFGAPPESYYPYDISKFDDEPSAFLYSYAQNYQAISYFRLDPPGTSNASLLNQIKTNLNSNIPAMFGFTVYDSYGQTDRNGGCFPFPVRTESIVGGHAIMAVGYDDTKKIKNLNSGSTETTGALMIRNSWGSSWGDGGYGWLPYDYVTKGLTSDWWSMIKAEWVDSDLFSE